MIDKELISSWDTSGVVGGLHDGTIKKGKYLLKVINQDASASEFNLNLYWGKKEGGFKK